MTRDELNDTFSEKAFQAGKKFGKEHSLSEFADDRDSKRLMDNCPLPLRSFDDVFKYGCQSSWRRKGELLRMIGYDLEPGDVFKIEEPDPESPVRVCLTNDKVNGLRFGWPNSRVWFVEGKAKHDGYWCYMGNEVPVELVRKEDG